MTETPTRPTNTPLPPSRWAALDTLTFRTRHSWWAPWAITTQAAFLGAFAWAAPQGEPGIALIPYTVAALALAHPRNTRRAAHGTRLLPAAIRARHAWAEHMASPQAAPLRGCTSRARRGLTGHPYRTPRIARIERDPSGGLTIYAENLPDVTLDAWHATGPSLARRLRLSPPTVTEASDGRLVRLTFPPHTNTPHTDTAPSTILAALPARTAPLPDPTRRHPLHALPIARREDGTPYLWPAIDNHTLVIGFTGSGKGSVIWAIVRELLPYVHDGTVQLWGVDPKRGMELGIGRELFTRLVAKTDDRERDITLLLEELAAFMGKRGDRLYDQYERKFTPTVEEPFVLLIFDEALMLGLFSREWKERAEDAFAEIVSQGRAAGVGMLMLAQIAQKTVLLGPMRDLIPTRICLRVPTLAQVRMTMGDDAVERGALAHQIPNDRRHQGVGYVIDEATDGRAACVRFDFTDDQTIREMSVRWQPPAAVEAPGLPLVGEVVARADEHAADPIGEDDEEHGEASEREEATQLPAAHPAPPAPEPDGQPGPPPAPGPTPNAPKLTAREKCLNALTRLPDTARTPTVRELADLAGVSTGTASSALREWKERVQP